MNQEQFTAFVRRGADAQRAVDRVTRPRLGLAPIGDVIAAVIPAAPPLEHKRALIDRLELLDDELHQLLAHEAPATYAELRRPLVQVMRRVRRSIRALERARSQFPSDSSPS